MTKSNGTTKRGRLRQPEIITKIQLCRKDQLPACQDRLVRVFHTASGETLYSPCHAFAKMRREFKAKFGRPMRGVTDTYDGPVRTNLDIEQLVKNSNSKELWWVLERIELKDDIVH